MAAKYFTLAIERVREALDYEPLTGLFTWNISSGKARPGKRAGSYGADGYWFITVDKCPCQAANLAFFHYYGRWPNGLLDHKNHIVDDNSISNLREATVLQNTRNRRTSRLNKSGYKGVFWWRYRNCWRAVIMVNYKQKLLGHFKTQEDAARAYDKASRELFGEFAFYNFPQEQVLQ